MKTIYQLIPGNYVKSPTKDCESIITATDDNYVYVNGKDDPVPYQELGLLRIGISFLKNAGFYEAEKAWEWKHDTLPDYTLEMDYDGIARFKPNRLSENVRPTCRYVHHLQNEFQRLAKSPLAVRW